jgi:hypothetical protein
MFDSPLLTVALHCSQLFGQGILWPRCWLRLRILHVLTGCNTEGGLEDVVKLQGVAPLALRLSASCHDGLPLQPRLVPATDRCHLSTEVQPAAALCNCEQARLSRPLLLTAVYCPSTADIRPGQHHVA